MEPQRSNGGGRVSVGSDRSMLIRQEVQLPQRGRTMLRVIDRLANRPGMAGFVPELTHGVPCPGRGLFFSGNVKIDHWVWMAVH